MLNSKKLKPYTIVTTNNLVKDKTIDTRGKNTEKSCGYNFCYTSHIKKKVTSGYFMKIIIFSQM